MQAGDKPTNSYLHRPISTYTNNKWYVWTAALIPFTSLEHWPYGSYNAFFNPGPSGSGFDLLTQKLEYSNFRLI